MIDVLRRLWRGTQAVTDLSGMPLPYYMRLSAGLPPLEPQRVIECGTCHTRYFARATGSAVPEDGRCWACSTGAPRVAVPTNAEVTHLRDEAAQAIEMRKRSRSAVADFRARRRK